MQNRLRFIILPVLIGINIILLTACKDRSNTTESTPSSKSQLPVDLPRQDILVVDQIFRYSVVENFNLWMPGIPSPTRQGLIMDSLWYIDQETGQQINSLSTASPSYNEDFTQMTVKLRSEVYWSDGVEFTADDLVFTVNNLKSNPGMLWSTELELFVKEVKKVDKYTVIFELKDSNPRFHYQFTVRYNAVWMQPKHIWQNVEDPMTFKFNPPVTLAA